ncbi:hypothetical protein TVAG_010990 [Trichomonas vaginalis G3]|uniref:SH3 domain-containing protein n=1 Tax=Trichomonas vaginalis (strain ATCC PRA-98 / G3) TaxID=412133 RepID=A2DP25_TRIV3|nr:hypothetical protein TVAGG3_0989300 [Trichomonas vaginalis G3]EAY17874.1 hypothetical protein TVAG_010990 [Trichomonas vaginalis G3]KAI5489908.1 hypothetical protein TVAGG3_0989300 [Trichomonas vaginalis G3]|eukprot:XP_001330009.1 hypothetical protein [Trichomonas vaginalis G3]
MAATFRPYGELPLLLDQAVERSRLISETLQQYVLEYAQDFESLQEKISKLAFDPLIHKDEKSAPDPNEFHSEIFKEFPKMAVKNLLQVKSYEYAAHQLKKFANSNIASTQAHYAGRAAAIKKSLQEELARFEEARQKNDEAKNRFNLAGCVLRDAEAKGVKDLGKLQQDFIEARRRAINANTKSRIAAEASTQNMEALVTQIEELENWRSEELKSILLDLSAKLANVANHLITTSSDMAQSAHELPLELDSTIISNFNQFRRAGADDAFQLWSVHPLTSQYLPQDQLFKKEREAGGVQLFVVKENYNGPANHLNAYAGEIVCGLKQEGEYYLCKNINDSVGLLPTSLLNFM